MSLGTCQIKVFSPVFFSPFVVYTTNDCWNTNLRQGILSIMTGFFYFPFSVLFFLIRKYINLLKDAQYLYLLKLSNIADSLKVKIDYQQQLIKLRHFSVIAIYGLHVCMLKFSHCRRKQGKQQFNYISNNNNLVTMRNIPHHIFVEYVGFNLFVIY